MKPALFNPGWLGELRLEKKGIRVKKTGALVGWEWGNLIAVGRSIITQTMIRTLNLVVQLAPGRSYRIKFLPMKPAPWYLIWAVVQASKGGVTEDTHRADVLFFFDDLTRSKHELGATLSEALAPKLIINQQCTDISKSQVEQVFARVFGYSLAIDPTIWQGKAVEKSDENGAHDGRIVDCPRQPIAGKVYERLLVNSDNGHTVLDYRSPTIGGEIPLVFIKERPINQRFANFNTKVRLVKPAQLFSPEELLLLSRFCREMGLDFGGLDVLRNREDGRIYVVDVNKTDMGPPTSLGFVDQFRALRILAAAFRKFVLLRLT